MASGMFPHPSERAGASHKERTGTVPPTPPELESGLVCPPSKVRSDEHGDGGWVSCKAAPGAIPGGVNLTPSGKVLGLKIVCWGDQRKGQRLVLWTAIPSLAGSQSPFCEGASGRYRLGLEKSKQKECKGGRSRGRTGKGFPVGRMKRAPTYNVL